jgi:hypothetical protein
MKHLTKNHKIDYNSFINRLKELKKTVNTIADLRNMWVDEKHSKLIRIVSNLFFRKFSLHYIFNSRITNYNSHIKYRQSLWKAIESPESFNCIKYY